MNEHHTSLRPSDAFAAASDTASRALHAIGPDQHHLATPLAGMDVAQLAEHFVMVQRRVACAGRGEPIAQWPVDAADVGAGGWADAFDEADADVHRSWTDAALDRPTALPWGVFSGAEVLGVYTNELIVHTWDLAQALAIEIDWSPEVLDVALAAIHAQLPDADRRPMWDAIASQLPPGVEWEDPFADAVPVPDDASTIDRLVAWNGRTP